jgi:isopropylmalate/homocitrate/citramalate synthase
MSTTPWQCRNWFVSPWNFAPEVTKSWRFPAAIQIHDLTLRDGEQQAGVTFTKNDKVRIAEKLAEAGVHRIEAGTPAVSSEDEAAVREIARRKLGPKTFALARCVVEDVRRAADCGIDGAIVEIPCSEHMLEHAYKWPLEKAIDLSIRATQTAHEAGLYVVFFPIDSTRTDIDWYLTLIERVANEGHMDALALVDTTGTISPHAVPLMVQSAQARVKNKPLEVHFHNDFGHSVANTIAALAAGVQVAHVTVSGMGERAGNTPLEETVISLLLQYGIDTGIKYDKLYDLSAFVRRLSGHVISNNRSIVGKGLFEVESGIIVDWWYNCGDEHLLEVFPYRPQLVGQRAPKLILGKLSGRPSILMALEKRGIRATDAQVAELLLRVKERSIQTRAAVGEADFDGIVAKVLTPA